MRLEFGIRLKNIKWEKSTTKRMQECNLLACLIGLYFGVKPILCKLNLNVVQWQRC